MDRVVIPGLPVPVRVGVTAEERQAEQEILLDLELYLDLAAPGRRDDLRWTVDYDEACQVADSVVRAQSFRLIESLAETVAGALLEAFDIAEVVVCVRKPGALTRWGVPYAAVEIRRARHG